MADNHIDITGWLVAEAEATPPSRWSGQDGGRMFLFRTATEWTLLDVQHSTHWNDHDQPDRGWGSVRATTYLDLSALKAGFDRDYRSEDWRALVRAGAENDRELSALWVPVQIDIDLSRESSVHRRDMGAHGDGRRTGGWRDTALGLGIARLEEIGFVVLASSIDIARIFRRRLRWTWNPVVGAATVAKYGYRADVVIAIDGFGEIYTRSPDTKFDPGERRQHPPRPLTEREAQRVDEVYEQRRADALRELDREEGRT